MEQFKEYIRKHWLIWSVIIIIILFIILLMIGNNIDRKNIDDIGWKWYSELISAVLGAAIVTTVTFLLLNGQEKKESSVEQKKKVFENRLKAYEAFLNLLCDVVVKNEVTRADEKRLQFSVATIGVHANSKEMYELSKNLKNIILKIKIDDAPNSSLWNEVINIVIMFQKSLYDEDIFADNTLMTKALCNFSGICTPEHHEVLEYVECMISGFGFDTFIADGCLFVGIPIKSEMIKSIQEESCYEGVMPEKIYITLKIEGSKGSKHEGFIAVYCGKTEKEQAYIEDIYKDNNYWRNPDSDGRKKTDFKKNFYFVFKENNKEIKKVPFNLSVNTVHHARILSFRNRTDIEIQSILTDIFSSIKMLWAEKGRTIMVKTLKKDEEKETYFLVKQKLVF